MNFELSEDQRFMRESFGRFLDEHSSMERVRAAAEATGFDVALWRGLAELGAFSLRIPEQHGGLGLGVMDAAVLMEESGRMLASGPLAEALVAARVLAMLAGDAQILTALVAIKRPLYRQLSRRHQHHPARHGASTSPWQGRLDQRHAN